MLWLFPSDGQAGRTLGKGWGSSIAVWQLYSLTTVLPSWNLIGPNQCTISKFCALIHRLRVRPICISWLLETSWLRLALPSPICIDRSLSRGSWTTNRWCLQTLRKAACSSGFDPIILATLVRLRRMSLELYNTASRWYIVAGVGSLLPKLETIREIGFLIPAPHPRLLKINELGTNDQDACWISGLR